MENYSKLRKIKAPLHFRTFILKSVKDSKSKELEVGLKKGQYNVYEKLIVYEKFEYPANMLVPSFAIFFFFLWHFLLTLFIAEIETVKHFNSSCSYTSDDEACMLNCTVSVTGKNHFK